MSNFLKSQIANLALAVELSVLGAVIVFMITASLGVDNATNDRHYVVHALPMRTTFVELGWKY